MRIYTFECRSGGTTQARDVRVMDVSYLDSCAVIQSFVSGYQRSCIGKMLAVCL